MTVTHNPIDLPDAVRSAATHAGLVLGDAMTSRDVGGHFTCSEAEALADLLRAVGEDVAAERFIAGHAESDEAGDLHAEEIDDEDRCEGHETLSGAYMGSTVYCDGKCNP